MNNDVIAAMKQSAVKAISGYGSFTSATNGANTVRNRAMTLQIPIVVVPNTSGNKSRWPMYKFEKLPHEPKFAIVRHAGTTYYLNVSDAFSENMTGIEPKAEIKKNISMTLLVCMHL